MKKISSFFILICLYLSTSKLALAGNTEWTQVMIDPMFSAGAGATLKVKDPRKFLNLATLNYQTRVTLSYDNKLKPGIEAWVYKVYYQLSYYDQYGVKQGPDSPVEVLEVSGGTSPVSKVVKLYDQPANNYPYVILTIVGFPGVPPDEDAAPSDIRLELTNMITEASTAAFPFSPTLNFTSSASEINLNWNYIPGATKYHLEWVYIDNYLRDQPSSVAAAFTIKEPTRITTTNQYYKMVPTYAAGKLYFRIRPVGIHSAASATERYGAWSNCGSTYNIAVGNITAANNYNFFNWQSVNTFAEDGTYKKVVSYFDGSLRNRQTLTNLSSEDMVLGTETLYDYEGRGVLNVLPTPIEATTALNYVTSLNTFVTGTKSAYDKYGAVSEAMASTSGSSKYYSSSNAIPSIHKDYIPNAEGYPYSEVEYSLDGTGKVTKQSGVGKDFRIDASLSTSKFTQFDYATPTETELKRLFGSNVGNAIHYKKIITTDPNGQNTVTYQDMAGRTVATALLGSVPMNLEPLASSSVTTPLTSKLSSSVIDKEKGTSVSTSLIYNAVPGTEHTINYSLITGDYQYELPNLDDPYDGPAIYACEECEYDLNIKVVNPDNTVLHNRDVLGIKDPNNTCYNIYTYLLPSLNMPLTFGQTGVYKVTKTLSISSAKKKAFLDNVVKTMKGYPVLQDYENSALFNMNTESCGITCESKCDASVKKANPTATAAQLQTLIAACVSTCTNTALTETKANECSSMLKNIKDQILQNVLKTNRENPNSTIAVPTDAELEIQATSHPEYGHYTRCTQLQESALFDKKLAIIKDWNEATTLGYITTNVLTNADPLFTSSLSNSSKTPSTLKNEIVTAMDSYFSESINQFDLNNNGAMNEVFKAETFITYPIAYGKLPGYVPTPQEKWLLFRSIYAGIKQKALVESNTVPYLSSEDAIVGRPLLSTTKLDLQLKIDELSNANCSDQCEGNVVGWMALLESRCSYFSTDIALDDPTKTQDRNTIKTNLQAYCTSSCGNYNPFGYLLIEELSHPNLMNIETVLTPKGCAIADIASSNPYNYNCEGTTSKSITSCATNFTKDLNKLVTAYSIGTTDFVNNINNNNVFPGENTRDKTYSDFRYPDRYAINVSMPRSCSDCESTDYYYLAANYDATATDFELVNLFATTGNEFTLANNYPFPGWNTTNLCAASKPVALSKAKFRKMGVNDATKYLAKWQRNGLNRVIRFEGPYLINNIVKDIFNTPSEKYYFQVYRANSSTPEVYFFSVVQGSETQWPKFEKTEANSCVATGLKYCNTNFNIAKTGYSFIATNSVVTTSYTNAFRDGDYSKFRNPITIEFWTQVGSLGPATRTFFDLNNSLDPVTQTVPPFRLQLVGNDLKWFTPLATNALTVNFSEHIGKWVHIAVATEGANGSFRGIYLNGKLVASDNLARYFFNPTATETISIGNFNNSQVINGMMSDFRIWRKVRLPEEISSTKEALFNKNTPALLIYYPLTALNRTTLLVVDNSNSGFNGAASNTVFLADGNALVSTSCIGTVYGATLNLPITVTGKSYQISFDGTALLLPNQLTTYTGTPAAAAADLVTKLNSSSLNTFFTFTASDNTLTAVTKSSPMSIYKNKSLVLYEVGSTNTTVNESFIKLLSNPDYINGLNLSLSSYNTSLPYKSTLPFTKTTIGNIDFDVRTPSQSWINNTLIFKELIGSSVSFSISNNFELKYEGYLYVPETGIYDFNLQSDNGHEFFIDDFSFSTLWSSFHNVNITGKQLSKGFHKISLKYYNDFGSYSCRLSWKKSTDANYTIIPSSSFFRLNGQKDEQDCNCANALQDDITVVSITQLEQDCKTSLIEAAKSEAKEAYDLAVQEFEDARLREFYSNCFSFPFAETFTYFASVKEYHYTLYYYDQAGNLVSTVPPAGVVPLSTTNFTNGVLNANTPNPAHKLVTTYKYNSLNQLVFENTPDGSDKNYFYDRKGQLRLSQNKEQNFKSTASQNQYTFVKYDKLGRMTLTGQLEYYNKTVTYLTDPTNEKELLAELENIDFPSTSTTMSQLTITEYGNAMTSANALGRVSRTARKASNTASLEDESSVYHYDIHGNVKKLVKNINGLPQKTIEYDYDLISGKVNYVWYQRGQADQFSHRYEYDADLRIRRVFTSQDGILWNKEAKYFYYKHGPLARVELGNQIVQGKDYYYTMQGWIKGVNMPGNNVANFKLNYDLSKDGNDIATNINKMIPMDEYAYSLSYYKDDYKPIVTTNSFGFASSALMPWSSSSTNQPDNTDNTIRGFGLYNGNIAAMTTQLASLGRLNELTQVAEPWSNAKLLQWANAGIRTYAYRYDQLNRITNAYNYEPDAVGTSLATRTITINSKPLDCRYSYDPNGNIDLAKINGTSNTLMDDLSYKYDPTLVNRLTYVTDAMGTVDPLVYKDLGTQASTNYAYDKIGNIVKDEASGITAINWDIYNKINAIVKTSTLKTEYYYDAMGNRVRQRVISGATAANYLNTYYVRDAQGNVMATYTRAESGSTFAGEFHTYGSERLGMYTVAAVPTATSKVATDRPTARTYELSNHLGNVLAVVTGLSVGVDDVNNDGIFDRYRGDVVSLTDYYPFGAQQPGRYYNNKGYRYGFNGKENNNDVKGAGNQQDYGFRVYDPRLGRFLSVDPLTRSYPWYTPYQFAGNKPIIAVDLDGLEEKVVILGIDKDGYQVVLKTLTSQEAIAVIFNTMKKNVDKIGATSSTEYIDAQHPPDYGTLLVGVDQSTGKVVYTYDPKRISKSFLEKAGKFIEKADEILNKPVETAGIGVNAKLKLGNGRSVGGELNAFAENELTDDGGEVYGLLAKGEGSLKVGGSTNGKPSWVDKPGGEAGIFIFTQSNRPKYGFKAYHKQTADAGLDVSLYGFLGFKAETSIDMEGNRTNKYGLYINTDALGGKNITDKFKVSGGGSEKAGATYSIKTQ